MLTAVSFFILLSVFFIPGASIVLACENKPLGFEKLSFYALGVSSAYLVLVSLVLLRYGMFNYITVGLMVLSPTVIALLVNSKADRKLINISPLRISFSWHTVLIMVLFGAMIAASPKWNFLIAPNMDAGNYEVYSNHFWTTGSLYFDLSSYLDKGVPVDWLSSRNTWAMTEGGLVGKPNYMYGYPVMLAIAKMIFNSPYISWVVNAIFSLFSAALIGAILFKLTKNSMVSFCVTAALCLTPLFFYYSKQIMSEQISLFGYLLFCYSLLEYFNRKQITNIIGVVAGLALVLLMKLDSFVIPGLFVASLVIVFIHDVQYKKVFQYDSSLLLAIGAILAVCVLMTVWLCNPKYVSHFSIPAIKVYGETAFIYFYMILLSAGMGVLAFHNNGNRFNKLGKCFSYLHLSQFVFYSIIVLWLYFIGWNLSIRPVGAEILSNHDKFNIPRLFTMFSPLYFIIFLVALPFAIKYGAGRYRVILLIGAIGLAVLIGKSNHSSPDIWWMRRYLVLLLPTTAVLIGVLFRLVVIKRWVGYKTAVSFVLGITVISVAIQYKSMSVFMEHKVNSKVPDQIAVLDKIIPDDALIIMDESNSVVRGTVNVLRSIRTGPTLLNVPDSEIDDAIGLYPEISNVVLFTQRKDDENEINNVGFKLVHEGLLQKQWANNLALLLNNPSHEKHSRYYLYSITRVQ